MKVPVSAETRLPTGQAGGWYRDAIQCVSLPAMHVAKQVARLCGDDSQVTVPWRSLTDAVGVSGTQHMQRAYTQRGAELLAQAGWLTWETVGEKRGAETTFYLLPGHGE
ncbi:hypothetical protein GCM10017562_21460 [Streptomyces roseofulvus]